MKNTAVIILLLLSSCVAGTNEPDLVRIERDVQIACRVWNDTKVVAVAVGFAVPAVSSTVLILSSFVDPVCTSMKNIDPTTAAWIMEQVHKLRVILSEYKLNGG